MSSHRRRWLNIEKLGAIHHTVHRERSLCMDSAIPESHYLGKWGSVSIQSTRAVWVEVHFAVKICENGSATEKNGAKDRI